jgi:hypothetical protein
MSARTQTARKQAAGNQVGGVLIEAALFVPIFLALLIGTVSLARVTYTYYMLEKLMYNLARYLGTQQGVNFCDGQDPTVAGAINYALTGATDSSDDPIVLGVTPSMFQVRLERYDPVAQQLSVCDCSATGCDPTQGGQPPDFIVVSLTEGYTVRPLFWGLTVAPFPLRPQVRVPYEGT